MIPFLDKYGREVVAGDWVIIPTFNSPCLYQVHSISNNKNLILRKSIQSRILPDPSTKGAVLKDQHGRIVFKVIDSVPKRGHRLMRFNRDNHKVIKVPNELAESLKIEEHVRR